MQFFRISYFEEKDRYMNKNSPKKKEKERVWLTETTETKVFFWECTETKVKSNILILISIIIYIVFLISITVYLKKIEIFISH